MTPQFQKTVERVVAETIQQLAQADLVTVLCATITAIDDEHLADVLAMVNPEDLDALVSNGLLEQQTRTQLTQEDPTKSQNEDWPGGAGVLRPAVGEEWIKLSAPTPTVVTILAAVNGQVLVKCGRRTHGLTEESFIEQGFTLHRAAPTPKEEA